MLDPHTYSRVLPRLTSQPIRVRYMLALLSMPGGWDRDIVESIAASVDAEYATHEDAAGPPDWEQWKYLLPAFINFR